MSKNIASASLVLLALGFAGPAAAAPVFPGASGVGLEPPPGMAPSRTFDGFTAGAATILITEMPAVAYAQIDGSRQMFVSRFGAKQADDVDVNGTHGFLIKGSATVGAAHLRKWVLVLNGKTETAVVSAQLPDADPKITEAAMDAALRTVAFRPKPGLDAQVAALPFAVGNLAGFRVSATALGAALILVDGASDVDPAQGQAHAVLTASEVPPPKDNREAFAKSQLQSFQAVRTTEVKSAKVFDAGGTQWAQVDAEGSEGQAETPVAITYFIRFDPKGFETIVCIAPRADAPRYADRFKSMALSVKPVG